MKEQEFKKQWKGGLVCKPLSENYSPLMLRCSLRSLGDYKQ
jgi:hypothetical protein